MGNPLPASAPTLSVIIPTHNRRQSLSASLQSLAVQECVPCRFEVVVVDDGGCDGSEQVASIEYPFQLIYTRQANRGAVAARRTGVEQAGGRLLVFLDDDITVSSRCIAAFARDLGEAVPGVVVGELCPPTRDDRRLFRDLYARLTATGPAGEISFLDCLGGLLGVTREDYFRIGGWQDVAADGRSAWCDVDFGYRAHRLGYRFRRAADAIGYHDDRAIQDWPTYCRQQEKAAELVVSLFRKYPELEGYIPAYRDKGPIRRRADDARLIGRKLLRQAASARPAMWLMSAGVRLLERRGELSLPLVLLYRWTISGHIYRGYRRGLSRARLSERPHD